MNGPRIIPQISCNCPGTTPTTPPPSSSGVGAGVGVSVGVIGAACAGFYFFKKRQRAALSNGELGYRMMDRESH